MDFRVLIADSAIAGLKEIVEFVAEDDPGSNSFRQQASCARIQFGHNATTLSFP
jgi:hypothetical protein